MQNRICKYGFEAFIFQFGDTLFYRYLKNLALPPSRSQSSLALTKIGTADGLLTEIVWKHRSRNIPPTISWFGRYYSTKVASYPFDALIIWYPLMVISLAVSVYHWFRHRQWFFYQLKIHRSAICWLGLKAILKAKLVQCAALQIGFTDLV